MPPKLDLSEQRFGRLVAKTWTRKNNHSAWECVCDCGKEVVVPTCRLRGGKTRSCGCLRAESKWGGRGVRRERAFYIWWGMLRRCNDPKNNRYKYYGGKNIRVCERWALSYDNFLADMGHPDPGMSIERRDNSKDYCPENCYWLIRNEQPNNRGNVRKVLHNGVLKTTRDLSKESGLPTGLIYGRLVASDWVVDEDTFRPVGQHRKSRNRATLSFAGRVMTIAQWARHLGICPGTIQYRLKKDLPLDRVLRPSTYALRRACPDDAANSSERSSTAVRLDQHGR